MLIIKHIKELATCKTNDVITDATVIIDEGRFIAFGKTSDLCPVYPRREDKIIDASGIIALPGFVDCHTHAVFAGSRAEEYRAKIQGEGYAEIHKKGGIMSTVLATRASSEHGLYIESKERLRQMLSLGTTTIEIKSGYGLTLADEMKILRVIGRLKKDGPQDIVSTFLGAHTIPPEFRGDRKQYVDLVIKKMLPTIHKARLADSIDVFCDELGFTQEEAEKVLIYGRLYGFSRHVHGEQTSHFGGAEAAAKFNALSLDHGEFLNDFDISLLKDSGTTVVLLPGVILHLSEWGKVDYPALAERLKAAGVPIAFATDHNPGTSPILSMKVVMDLGMRFFRLGYEDCLRAATINAAKALGLEQTLGSVEAGKQADLLLVRTSSVAQYLHDIGDIPIATIIKRGELI